MTCCTRSRVTKICPIFVLFYVSIFSCPNVFADAICEAGPLTFTELESKLRSEQSLIVTPVITSSEGWWVFSKEITRIGRNITVKGCQSYGGKGVRKLANDINAALNRGARCLANLDKWRPAPSSIRTIEYLKAHPPNPSLLKKLRFNIVQLLGFFANTSVHPLNSTCSKRKDDGDIKPDAVSATCGQGGTEAIMELDLLAFNKMNTDARQETIFHEFFHLIGYHHSKSNRFDVIWAIETCCFAPKWARAMADYSCADLVTRHHGDRL